MSRTIFDKCTIFSTITVSTYKAKTMPNGIGEQYILTQEFYEECKQKNEQDLKILEVFAKGISFTAVQAN